MLFLIAEVLLKRCPCAFANERTSTYSGNTKAKHFLVRTGSWDRGAEGLPFKTPITNKNNKQAKLRHATFIVWGFP